MSNVTLSFAMNRDRESERDINVHAIKIEMKLNYILLCCTLLYSCMTPILVRNYS